MNLDPDFLVGEMLSIIYQSIYCLVESEQVKLNHILIVSGLRI